MKLIDLTPLINSAIVILAAIHAARPRVAACPNECGTTGRPDCLGQDYSRCGGAAIRFRARARKKGICAGAYPRAWL